MRFDDRAWREATRGYAYEVGRSGRRREPLPVGRGRWAALAACGLLLGVAPFAIAGSDGGGVEASATGDVLREGVRNPGRGAASRETQVISRVTGSRFGTRQSNTSTGVNAGGAAVYGCRRPAAECTRHVNLAGGPAAHFQTSGPVPFSVAPGATGMVENLNANRVGGMTAAEIIGASQASVGPPGPAGPTGPQGPAGKDGSAVAYGFVGSNGTLLSPTTRAKNLTNANVIRASEGLYCFENVPARTFTANAQFGAIIATAHPTPEFNIRPSGCPGTLAATIGAVRTYNTAGALTDADFVVSFDD